MKKISLFLVLINMGYQASAQFDIDPGKMIDALVGPVESDRPGQALNPTTAGMFALQLQTGFSYSRWDIAPDNLYQSYYVPTNIRLGITRKWEVNTSFYYNKNEFSSIFGTSTTSGFLSPELGIRYAFMKGDKWRPFLALQSNMSFLSHNGDYQQDRVGCSFYLATSNRFDVMSVNTNIGVVFPGNDQFSPSVPWVINLGWMIGDKFGMFAEGFGEIRNGTLNWDAGMSYVVFSDLQLDLFGGMYNVIDHQNQWFAEIGVTYRFSFLKLIAKKKAEQFMKGFGG